jgi:hypothetical protein
MLLHKIISTDTCQLSNIFFARTTVFPARRRQCPNQSSIQGVELPQQPFQAIAPKLHPRDEIFFSGKKSLKAKTRSHEPGRTIMLISL